MPKNKVFEKPRIVCKDGRKAVCYWRRKEIYLGAWNGDGAPEPPILELWLRKCVEWEREHEAELLGIELEPGDDGPLTPVDVAIAQYIAYLASPDGGYMRTDGSYSCHFEQSRLALQPLSSLFGSTPVARFKAEQLETVQRAMIDHKRWWKGPDAERPRSWSRATINRRITVIVKFFAWCERRELVPEGRAEHLRLVPGLRKGRSQAKETPKRERVVTAEQIAAVLPYCSPQIAAMIRLQRLTAMRPAELVRIRGAEIEREAPVPVGDEAGARADGVEVWAYRPLEHKTDHLELPRTIYLGTAAQAVLSPFLEDRDPAAWCFDAKESRLWYYARRWPERKRPAWADGPPARFGTSGYRQAINRAHAAAAAAGVEVPRWVPYDLRHTRATEVGARHGARGAQALLGHQGLNVTNVYLHELDQAAREVVEAEEAAAKEKAKKKGRKPK